MIQANNSSSMREGNKKQIIKLISRKPQSRADLARATGLSRAAVTILTDSLIADGIILCGEAIKSEAGRRPTLLYPNSRAFVSVGVDLNRDGSEILIADFSGNKLFIKKSGFLENAEKTITSICDEIKRALTNIHPDSSVLGICVCAPGPIDSRGGIILNPPGLEIFHNYSITHAFSSRLPFPIYLEKDTNTLAIAENSLKETNEDLLFLLADHGIGCSIVKNGQLFLGRDGMGGELGHTTIDVNGPVCRCGNVGCAELYASIPATVERANADCWETLLKDAKNGNSYAINALRLQGEFLSVLCINAANIFEPQSIVLGGKLTDAAFILTESIEASLKRAAFSRGKHSFCVRSSQLGENARAYSAALTVIDCYLQGEK